MNTKLQQILATVLNTVNSKQAEQGRNPKREKK